MLQHIPDNLMRNTTFYFITCTPEIHTELQLKNLSCFILLLYTPFLLFFARSFGKYNQVLSFFKLRSSYTGVS